MTPNTTEITLELELEPDIDAMKRADLPAIWGGFREKFAVLQTTAETINVTDELDIAGMKIARTTRLAIKEIRVAVEAKRKELGEEALRRKQGIDADAKAIREICESLELRLESSEKFAERAAAARAAQRLAERTAAVIAAKGEPSSYNLAGCPDEAFAAILAALEAAEKARISAAEKAESDRLAAIADEAAEKERIRLENIRLAEELEAAKAKAFAERKVTEAALAKVQAEAESARKKQAAIEAERLRVEREKFADEAAKAKAESDRLAAEAKEKEDALRARMLSDAQARDLAEAKLAAQQAEAAKVAADAKRDAAKAAAAPDAEKLRDLVAEIRNFTERKMATPAAAEIQRLAAVELEEVAAKLEARIATL